jgi:glycosyltransferase involved in cell wall biosynthesis
MRILFIAPLPDPITGQSLACQVFHDDLVGRHELEVININKSSLRSGVGSLGRVAQVLGHALRAGWCARRSDRIYFTISESLAGNIKDMLIYLACLGRLDRMVVHLHGGAGMRVLMHERPLLAVLNRFFLARLGAVVLLGRRHLDIVRDLPDDSHVHLVPNFAQDELFLAPEQIKVKFTRGGPLRLLYLSNLIPGKGYLELLEAYASLHEDKRARIELAFAGAFESESDRRQFLVRIAAWPTVRYCGVVGGEAKTRLLAQAHLLCLPTYYPYEGQPISILEAYASGCAVMTTDHSGIFDIFEPERCGIEVQMRSPASIAEALHRALADPDALRRAGLHNRQLADKSFRVSSYNRALTEVLERLPRRPATN